MAEKKLGLSLPKEEDKSESRTPLVDAFRAKLEAEKDKLEKELAPYREYHDNHCQDKKFNEAKQKIAEISAKLGPINNELSALVATNPKNKTMTAEVGEYKNKSTE